jgi:hypothetical protein
MDRTRRATDPKTVAGSVRSIRFGIPELSFPRLRLNRSEHRWRRDEGVVVDGESGRQERIVTVSQPSSTEEGIVKRNLLIGLLAIVGLAAVVFNPLLGGALALACWTYLVWIVQARDSLVFKEYADSTAAEPLLRRLKTLLRVAGVALAVFVVAVVLHNTLSARIEGEEAAWFLVALVALGVFVLATAGGLLTFAQGRRRRARG